MGYLGDISKESFDSIVTRLKRKLLTRRSKLFLGRIKEIMGSRGLSDIESRIFEVVSRRLKPKQLRAPSVFEPILKRVDRHLKPK